MEYIRVYGQTLFRMELKPYSWLKKGINRLNDLCFPPQKEVIWRWSEEERGAVLEKHKGCQVKNKGTARRES